MPRRALWIAALLSSLTAAGCSSGKATPLKKDDPEVLVTSPTLDSVTDFEEFIGHTDAVFTVEVRARITGFLDKVAFNDGDEVEKGVLLFQIDDRPYKAEYDRTVATLEQGKARLSRLSADHTRALALRRRDAIGQEEFDRIKGDFEEGTAAIGVYTAAVDRAKLDLDFTQVTAPIGGRLSRRMVDPGNLVQADQTALTTIVSLDPMYVYFDIDERTLLKIRRLIAEGKVKSRQEAEVPILVGLSDEADYPHRGTINFSDNKVDSGTGTLRVRGVIANPKPRLLSPGIFVRVRLPLGEPKKSLLIDEEAIGTEQGNKFVYVVRKGPVAMMDPSGKPVPELDASGRPVIDPETKKPRPKTEIKDVAFRQYIKVGSQKGNLRVVLEDKMAKEQLSPDDRVIISGLQRVKAANPVKPVPYKRPERPTEVAAGPPAQPPAAAAAPTTAPPAAPPAPQATK